MTMYDGPLDLDHEPGAKYAGWTRHPDGRWQRVLDAATREDAWTGLLNHRAHGAHADRVVLPAGINPNDRRTGRPRPCR